MANTQHLDLNSYDKGAVKSSASLMYKLFDKTNPNWL